MVTRTARDEQARRDGMADAEITDGFSHKQQAPTWNLSYGLDIIMSPRSSLMRWLRKRRFHDEFSLFSSSDLTSKLRQVHMNFGSFLNFGWGKGLDGSKVTQFVSDLVRCELR
jgi:hypothetical protein